MTGDAAEEHRIGTLLAEAAELIGYSCQRRPVVYWSWALSEIAPTGNRLLAEVKGNRLVLSGATPEGCNVSSDPMPVVTRSSRCSPGMLASDILRRLLPPYAKVADRCRQLAAENLDRQQRCEAIVARLSKVVGPDGLRASQYANGGVDVRLSRSNVTCSARVGPTGVDMKLTGLTPNQAAVVMSHLRDVLGRVR